MKCEIFDHPQSPQSRTLCTSRNPFFLSGTKIFLLSWAFCQSPFFWLTLFYWIMTAFLKGDLVWLYSGLCNTLLGAERTIAVIVYRVKFQ